MNDPDWRWATKIHSAEPTEWWETSLGRYIFLFDLPKGKHIWQISLSFSAAAKTFFCPS
jgi:hypothetical protein